MTHLKESRVLDGAGNPIGSLSGALDVHTEDVHTRPINQIAFRETGVQTTPTANVAAGATTFTLTSAVGWTQGDSFHIEEAGVVSTVNYKIIGLAGAVVTLDMPIDRAFTTAADILQVVDNMASIAGTISAPISYTIHPHAGEVWHVNRFLISMIYGTNTDDSRFGDIAGGLGNGVLLRAYVGGIFSNFTNWKTNGNIARDMYDLSYTDKAGGGNYGLRARGSVKIASGAVIALDGDAGDYAEVLIQDDITALDNFSMKFQAHLEGA